MPQSGASHSSDTAEEGYDMEFRSFTDDAWYSIRLLLEGDRSKKLRVKYDNFPDDIDDVFQAENFKSEEEIYDFVGRFRKVSAQLQDHDCSKVVKGMRVCASDTFADGEVLFYDAIVDDVLHKEHSNLSGQEECNCIFLLFWLHGPNVGNVSDKGVANICLPQDSELHPKVATFMEIAIQNSRKASHKFVSGTTSNVRVIQLKENNSSLIVKQTGNLRQGKYAQWSLNEVSPSKGGNCDERQDTDVGGDKKLYVILVQNLEKELSSLAVSKFIHKQTSIATQVYIFPSLPWEPYTNGVIMLNCKKDVERRLFGFLQNPNHFIVSSNGRPWVATEKISMNDHWTLMLKAPENERFKVVHGTIILPSFRPPWFLTLLLLYKVFDSSVYDGQKKLHNRRDDGLNNELKVVCSGTKEYEKAKEVRDLFLQFIDHQKRLYKKLCAEEISIL